MSRLEDVTPEWMGEWLMGRQAAAFSTAFSARNAILLAIQDADAVYCQSYGMWKRLGYGLRPDARPLRLYAPVKQRMVVLPDGRSVPLADATEAQKAEGMIRDGWVKDGGEAFRVAQAYDVRNTTFPEDQVRRLMDRPFTVRDHRRLAAALCEYASRELASPVILTEGMPGIPGGRRPIHIPEAAGLSDTALLYVLAGRVGEAMISRTEEERERARGKPWRAGKVPPEESAYMAALLRSHLGFPEQAAADQEALMGALRKDMGQRDRPGLPGALEGHLSRAYAACRARWPAMDACMSAVCPGKLSDLRRKMDAARRPAPGEDRKRLVQQKQPMRPMGK